MRADGLNLVAIQPSVSNCLSHGCGGPQSIRTSVCNSVGIRCGCITCNGAENLCPASFSGRATLKHQCCCAFSQDKARTGLGKRTASFGCWTIISIQSAQQMKVHQVLCTTAAIDCANHGALPKS